ncbi:MAG: hypothetical protein A2020_01815 [Lentisphaerae bacterium GWF2_45_14]|nr:MAG: hypothetical protein A2020_01815 [Lentisphaerae bacterium GWF2_45_14]
MRWLGMKAVAGALCLAVGLLSLGEEKGNDGLVFHFDFKDSAGKKELTDKTGNVKCISKNRDFVIQQDALRLASCAEIYIPSENLPEIKDELTISAWILKKSTPEYAPILFKGTHPGPIQFLFTLSWRYPGFCYKLPNQYYRWNGISINGLGGSSSRYDDEKLMIPGAQYVESSGYWKNLTAVFNRGKVELYIDGKLVAKRISEKSESLQPDKSPIWIGAEKVADEKENYMSADMLLNDLRMYKRALSPGEVKSLYETEEGRYPKGSQIPKGETHINALPVCRDYIKAVMKGYDPEFNEKLKMTEEYEKHLPSNTYGGRNIETSVKLANGRTYLAVDGKIKYPVLFLPSTYDFTTNKYIFREMALGIKDFSAAGIELFSMSVFPDYYCIDENKYDWQKLDDLFKKALEANPAALILVEYFLITPPWFEKKYPDEMEKCYFGKSLRVIPRVGPLGSEKWLEISKKILRDVVSHIEASDYAGHVIGYNPCGGQSGEWYWPGSVYGGFTGYSKGTRESFRKWLRGKYNNNNELLKKAWNDSSVTFNSAEVPPPEARMANDNGMLFLDPVKYCRIFDIQEFKNDMTVLNMEEAAKTIKESCSGKKLVFEFSGYVMSMNSHKMYNAGLRKIDKLFSSSYIDSIACLLEYGQRRGGESGLNVNPFNGTAALRGKMIWQEDDLRTHFHTKMESGRTSSLEETITVIKRGFGYSITRNIGFWWRLFDNTWFHQEDIMETVAEIKKAADKSMSTDESSVSEVAFIFDEKSPFYLTYAPNSTFLTGQCWGAYQEAARMGAPFDVYLMSDIKDKNMPDYKLYVFLNAYYVDEATRKAIDEKVKKNSAVSVWCYAPGYISEKGFDIDGMEKLTGMKFDIEKVEKTLTLQITDTSSAISKYVSSANAYKFGPIFYCRGDEMKVIGTANGKTALTVKEFKDWRSVYSLMPLTKGLLMGLCDYAGVHVYSRSFDVLSANRSHIMLHTSTAGEKTILLPKPSNVSEIITGERLGDKIDKIVEKLPAQATRIYEIKE